VDGKPAAMCFRHPDVNEMVKDFDGELMRRPLNLARLLWRLKFNRPKHARCSSSRQGGIPRLPRYGTLARRPLRRGRPPGRRPRLPGRRALLDLEDNVMINRGIERMAPANTKPYRVYEKQI